MSGARSGILICDGEDCGEWHEGDRRSARAAGWRVNQHFGDIYGGRYIADFCPTHAAKPVLSMVRDELP